MEINWLCKISVNNSRQTQYFSVSKPVQIQRNTESIYWCWWRFFSVRWSQYLCISRLFLQCECDNQKLHGQTDRQLLASYVKYILSRIILDSRDWGKNGDQNLHPWRNNLKSKNWLQCIGTAYLYPLLLENVSVHCWWLLEISIRNRTWSCLSDFSDGGGVGMVDKGFKEINYHHLHKMYIWHWLCNVCTK